MTNGNVNHMNMHYSSSLHSNKSATKSKNRDRYIAKKTDGHGKVSSFKTFEPVRISMLTHF